MRWPTPTGATSRSSSAGTARPARRACRSAPPTTRPRGYTITLAQGYGDASPAARATQQGPLLIPFALGLIGRDGRDLPLRLDGEAAASGTTRVLEFTAAEQTFTFVDVAEEPLPSLLRNFSAPVIVEYDYSDDELRSCSRTTATRSTAGKPASACDARAAHAAARAAANEPLALGENFIAAFRRVLTDDSCRPRSASSR
jgi:aminopeptidase N